MKTQDDIKALLTGPAPEWAGWFWHEVILDYADFSTARPVLKADFATKVDNGEVEWKATPLTRTQVLADMKRYMGTFGWDKAMNHRGLSAGRTIEKMRAWAWLLGDEELERKIDETPYPWYGAPILKAICLHLGWPIPDEPFIVKMMNGERCPDCEG